MKRALKIQWKAYTVAKLGNSPEENEDAFSPEVEHQTITVQAPFACAVADGATQASFSRIWARLLVATAIQDYLPEHLTELTASASAQWLNHLSTFSLPWHAEEKARQGAFATLLWLSLQPAKESRTTTAAGSWKALAIGDTCLFQIRKKTLRAHFPPLAAADFNNTPWLLSSNLSRNAAAQNGTKSICTDGDWAPGDDFLLMTDALAAWFMREQENLPLPRLFTQLRSALSTAAQFAAWLQGLRANSLIKNDDTTIIWIHIED